MLKLLGFKYLTGNIMKWLSYKYLLWSVINITAREYRVALYHVSEWGHLINPKGINMILYLTLILKYWQYIVIALCSIVIVALLIRCNILDERNTSLKKEHELQLNTIVITNQAKAIELLKQQNETEKRISEVSERYEKQLNDTKTETIIKEKLQPIINNISDSSECFSAEWLSVQNETIRSANSNSNSSNW